MSGLKRGGAVRVLLGLGLVLGLGMLVLWLTGGLGWLETTLRGAQKAAQGQLAGALRGLKAGNPGAWGGLMAVCFAYGFLHAAGPGHGKLVIGGYGLAKRVGLWRLVALAVISSLAQAAVAVVLVLGGILVLGWGRDRLEWASNTVLAPVGTWAIIGLGVWIALRGVWRVWRMAAGGHEHGHHGRQHHEHEHQGHHHDGHDHDGHAHGPTLPQVQALKGWRDAALLTLAIAIRPCTGALFVLIITQSMGVGLAGVVGAFAMGLGTASVTALVAGLAVWAREGALVNLPGSALARALPVIEVMAGALIVIAAAMLLGRGA